MIPNAARDFNFDLGETADAIRETVRDFAQDKIAPRAEEIDRTNQFPRDLWPQMGALGLHGITVEEEYGGAGPRLSRACASRWRRCRAPRPRSASPTAPIPTSASTRSAATARDAQKRRYLPKLISGEHVGALAMSEPGAGSDVVSMRTRAEKQGDRYVLNGTKMWITNGPDRRDARRLRQDRSGRRPARHHRLPDREGHEGLLDAPEARQARHARLRHLRARLRGLRGAGGERARHGRHAASTC